MRLSFNNLRFLSNLNSLDLPPNYGFLHTKTITSFPGSDYQLFFHLNQTKPVSFSVLNSFLANVYCLLATEVNESIWLRKLTCIAQWFLTLTPTFTAGWPCKVIRVQVQLILPPTDSIKRGRGVKGLKATEVCPFSQQNSHVAFLIFPLSVHTYFFY